MSRYSKLLTKIIAESGYTAKQIVEKCNDIGNGIDTTRLSKLQNGKLPAPSEKVSRDIARICNADERLLVIEGYLEKAPKEIIDVFIAIKLMTTIAALSVFENKIDKLTLTQIKEELNKEPIADFIVSLLDNEKDMEINNDMLEFKAKQDNVTISFTEPLAIQVKDNAMFPKITEGAKITLQIEDKYKNGDVLAVKIKDEDIIVRYAFINKEEITLAPLNSQYETITYNLKDVVILGKVIKTINDI